MNKIGVRENHISTDYADGYEDGVETGANQEYIRILSAVNDLEPCEDDSAECTFRDGFSTAKSAILDIIKDGA